MKSQEYDQLFINDLEFYGTHGLFKEENKLGQRFFCDLILHLPLQEIGVNDNRNFKLDYIAVIDTTRNIVEKEEFLLIEAVTEKIASEILMNFPLIEEVTVRFTKPHPPYRVHFKGLGVQIHRTRRNYK